MPQSPETTSNSPQNPQERLDSLENALRLLCHYGFMREGVHPRSPGKGLEPFLRVSDVLRLLDTLHL